MLGTAPPARRWLLVELEGRWLPSALASLAPDPRTRVALEAVGVEAQARLMLIRRHGRQGVSARRAWCVVDDPRTATGAITTWGTWSTGGDLSEPADLLREQAQAALTRGAPNPDADRSRVRSADPELLLVCTHGKHDVCCATRGRPVAAALTARWPEATWECSHTGGDRFAANVIALPDGACYGGLDHDVAVPVLEQHFSAGPDTAYLRGWTGRTPPEQAAVIAVHRALPGQPWGSITPVEVSSSPRQHRVQLSTPVGPFVVPVTEHVREAHQLTCAALTANRATVPVAGEVQPLRV